MAESLTEEVQENKPAYSESIQRIQKLSAEIMKRREVKLSANIKNKPRTSIWASQFTDCERQMTYEFLNWTDKKLHTWELEALFAEGRKQEELFKAQLRELGFELVEDGAPISDDIRLKYGVNGYLDTRIKWDGVRVPVEMKLVNQMIFDRIREGVEGSEDMRRIAYMRKYLNQGTIYMLGTNEPAMMFALTDGRGHWKFIPFELDMITAERLLQTAERVNAKVKAKELPARIPYDSEICGRCSFAHICIPDINKIPSSKILGNEKLASLLERRDQLKESASEYAKIDKIIRGYFEDIKDGIYTIGNFIVTRFAAKRKKLEMTDAEKKQFETMEDYYKNKIERFQKPDPETIYLPPRRIFLTGDEE